MKYFLFSVLFYLSVVSGSEDVFRAIDKIVQEESCAREGGMCTILCPKDQLADKPGLCPLQQKNGVECCYGTSAIETRCAKNGGWCMTGFCNEKLIIRGATDCLEGQKCCVLV